MKLDDLQRWRLRLDDVEAVLIDDEACLPLAALPGAEAQVDEARLHLELRVDPRRFATTVRSGKKGPREKLTPSSDPVAFLNYELSLISGEDRSPAHRGRLELNLAHPARLGHLRSAFGYQSVGPRRFTRLATSWTRDLPARRRRLVIGDGITAGGALARALPFAGIRWGTHFELDPSFVKTPQLDFDGLLDQTSQVAVWVDELPIWTERLPPGPFALRDLPATTRAGEARLVITDLEGYERVVSERFLSSSQLLKAGLSRFSCEMGFERRGVFAAGSRYDGRLFAAGTFRRGLSDRLTVEAHAEARADLQMLALGGVWSLPRLGSVVELGAAHGRGSDQGSRLFGSYELRRRHFTLFHRSEWVGSGFRQLGDERAQALRSLHTTRGDFDLGERGSLGITLVHELFRDAGDIVSAHAAYSGQLGPGRVFVGAFGTLSSQGQTFGARASYVLRIGSGSTVRWSGAARSGKGSTAQVEFRHDPDGSEGGLAFRARARRAAGKSSGDLDLSYRSRTREVSIEISQNDGALGVRSRLEGALVFLGGDVLLSPRIDRSFALIEIPGQEDVEVLLENRRVGRTDRKGRLLLPDLAPYQASRVAIDPTSLPIGLKIDVFEQRVVPFDNGGLKVTFDAHSERNVRITLVDATGEVLPPRSLVRSDDGRIEAQVARDGLVFLADVPSGPLAMSARSKRRVCRFTLEVPSRLAPLEHLGNVICR